MKSRLFYIFSIGLAFYAGMKFNKYKNVTNIKFGKFVVEFKDTTKCNNIADVKPTVEAVDQPIIKTPQKTETQEVLEPEKVSEKEPEMKKDELTEIKLCFEKIDEELESGEIDDFWGYRERLAECKEKDLIYSNCYYEDRDEDKKECNKIQKKKAESSAHEIAFELFIEKTPEQKAEIEAEEQLEKQIKNQEQKDLVKEAIMELKDENNI